MSNQYFIGLLHSSQDGQHFLWFGASGSLLDSLGASWSFPAPPYSRCITDGFGQFVLWFGPLMKNTIRTHIEKNLAKMIVKMEAASIHTLSMM
jgi:hypothetical protein